MMDADGSNQRRISFGGGGYATPVWSPRGDLIAFTKTGGFRIGVMTPDGSGERILTSGGGAEGPSWAPNGRAIMFTRGAQRRPALVCRRRQRRDPARADPARRIGPGLVAAAAQLTIIRMKKELMMNRRTSLIAIAALLSLTAGCAHHRTAAELPPQPPSASEAAENVGDQSGQCHRRRCPGSRRDFLQSVPSDRVFFDTDSYSLDAQSRTTLDAQAAWLSPQPQCPGDDRGPCRRARHPRI